jgi:hypothetical protein
MFWPTVAVLGFFFLAGVIVVLGASSTSRYEFERNGVQAHRRQATVPAAATAQQATVQVPHQAPQQQAAPQPHQAPQQSVQQQTTMQKTRTEPSTIGIGNHPAGRRLAEPAAEPAWWLVDESDESGDRVVAGPFPDAIDAEWVALSGGLDESVRVVHGVQRADGGLLRRQPPEERAWLAELGEQLDRLPTEWDDLLTDDDALTTLVVEIAAALVEAGLTLHDCAGDAPAGGVCLTPGPHDAGVVVSWHQHDRMSADQVRGAAMDVTVQRAMNAAVADLLERMGFEIEPFGSSAGCLVTDLRQV